MMRKLLIAAALLAVVGLFYYSWQGVPASAPPAASAPADPTYAPRIRQARQQKDNAFRSATSPIEVAQRAAFGGLRYYQPEATYRVVARLARAAVPTPLPLALTGGSADAYARWGTAEFELGGRPQKLVLLQRQGLGARADELFVPFTDPTNGRQTYAAGRYLDLPLPPPTATELVVDFNTAYNPFCAYNHAYSCPKPPADNHLTVPVLAGEQAYQP